MVRKIGRLLNYRNLMTLALFVVLFCPVITGIPSETGQIDQVGYMPNTSDSQQVDSLLWKMASRGMPGTHPTMRPFVCNFTDAGPNYIIVGTDKGLAVINPTTGAVKINFNTFEAVIHAVVTGDLSGDGQRDLVSVVLDQGHPNIFAISSADGRQLWSFNPTILGFNKETLLQQNYTTFSWDIESVEDLNGDGINDLIFSSWFRIYALNGASGEVLWANQKSCTDDIWKIVTFPDVNYDNHPEIAAGSHKGEVVLLNSVTGQEIWPSQYSIPEVVITYPGFTVTTKYFPVPVSDMAVGPDIDNDVIPDLLVTGDDGILRVISGRSGLQISVSIVYPNATDSREYYPQFQGTWYDYEERLFTKSGAKIYPMQDMDGDGGEDWMVYAFNLEQTPSSPSKDSIYGTFLNVKNTTIGQNVSTIVVGNWSSFAELGDASSPCLMTIGGQKRLYFYSTTIVPKGLSYAGGLFYYVYSKTVLPTGSPTIVAEIDDRVADVRSVSQLVLGESYLIDIGDITGDGVSDLFGFSRQDTYFTYDPNAGLSGKIIWIKHIQESSPSLITIDDLNGDGIQDFLYSSQAPISPEWGVTSTENNLNLDVCAINGLTGSAIWHLLLPSIYEGVMDIQNMGDLSGDGHADFAGWIIPTYVPQEIKDYIYQRTGAETISNEGIYRALLANYTRLIVIDGLTGNILDSQSLLQTPYRFYRTNAAALEQNQYYNRIKGEAPTAWFMGGTNYRSYNWGSVWDPSSLRHADQIQMYIGSAQTGSAQDTLNNNNVNYTIAAAEVGTEYQAVIDCNIQIDLDGNKSLGSMEYPLSELERVSALKIQSHLTVNRSDNPNFFNTTYSLYNFTSATWVSCNWTGAASWNSGTNVFPELYGNWSTSYRTSNDHFNFQPYVLRTDSMSVMMRGTVDRDTSMKLDHENKTSLSHFINPTTKTLSLRVNVTNGVHPFNLSIDSLGIVAMAWGLASGKYDKTYTWNYKTTSFESTELIDIQVQDFQVINGTGDNFLDILAITGYPTSMTNGGVSLRMFDLKNDEVFTKWTTNTTKLPYYKVRAQVMNTSQVNDWILTGAYTSGNPYYMSKRVLDPHWDSAISCFDNFIDTSVAFDVGAPWNSWKDASSIGEVETNFFFPTVIPVTKNGSNGLMIFVEQSKPYGYSIYGEFHILNATTFSNLGIVPCQVETLGITYGNLLSSGEGRILLSEDDFNGDGFIDHAGISEVESFDPYMGMRVLSKVRIYSGNVDGGSVPIILNETVISQAMMFYPSGETTVNDEEKHMPCASIGDTDGDGAAEFAIGLEAPVYSYSGQKGSSVLFVNLKKGIKTEYVFDPYSATSNYSPWGNTETQKDFYTRLTNIGFLATSQKSSQVFVERLRYIKAQYGYTTYPISEIIDLASHQTLLQVRVEVDSINTLPDLTGDGINEYLISSGGILYCYNSEFKVTFSNLQDGEIKTTNAFTVEWNSPASKPMYQLMVNNTLHGLTSSASAPVSLGGGWKQVKVLLYDSSGIFVAVDDATIMIPESSTMIIVTVIIVVGLVVVQIMRKKRKTAVKRKYDIEVERSASTPTSQYMTNAKTGEQKWKPNG